MTQVMTPESCDSLILVTMIPVVLLAFLIGLNVESYTRSGLLGYICIVAIIITGYSFVKSFVHRLGSKED